MTNKEAKFIDQSPLISTYAHQHMVHWHRTSFETASALCHLLPTEAKSRL